MTDDRMEARVTPIDIAFQKVRPALTHVAVLSIIANLSSLSFIVYSMVAMTYVLQTNNLATMYSLFALFVMFNLLSAIITAMMTYILKKTANIFSREMIAIISESSLEMRLNRSRSIGVEVIQDAETVRDFYVGINVVTLLRLPWALAYILFCFYENVWVGVFSILVVSVTPVLAILGAGENQEIKRAIFAAHMAKTHFVRSLAEKYEFLPAMGILKNLSLRWKRKSAEVVTSDLEAKHIEKFNNLFIKFWRYFATYTVGAIIAYLAIRGDVSMNIMLPASIAMGALAGIGQIAIYQWPNYLRARAAYDRLQGLFRAMEAKQRLLSLPRPDGRLEVKSLAVAAPGGTRFLLSQVSFGVPAGSAMGVIGPSGAGKSTLVRALVGIWPPSHGSVRLDGSELHHWDADELGSHLGYLPQNVELLSGTIAENIARFGEVDDEAVLEAARLAGVHDVIQGLAQGYNTQVGEGGSALSGGQRQRVGLARALYGRPALVVLDEPNSNLDALGESALADALKAMKERGTTCILVTHKANILKMVDLVLVLKEGTLSAFGPRDTILAPAGVPSIAPATVPPPRQLAARRTGDAA